MISRTTREISMKKWKKWLTIYLVFYLVCGVLTYGISLAYQQYEFPWLAKENCREDMGTSVFYALFPQPIPLVELFLLSGFAKYGMQFVCEVK